MGKVDTVLRYGRYNSYELDPGEELWSSKFDVDLYTHIAIQAQVIGADTATGQFIVQWLKSDGGKLSTVTESFDIATRWNRETWILEVPENAKYAMWAIKNTHNSRAWNFACGMAEPGPVAGAFDPALANMVSLMDAHGFYGGSVSADQVIAGILRSIFGDSGFDLEEPRIWMTSKDGEVTWEATPDNPLAIKNKAGDIKSGIMNIGGKYVNLADALRASGNVGNTLVEVEISPENPLLVKQDGEPVMYITGEDGISGPGKIVTSKYDLNEDGRVDHLDVSSIMAYFLGLYDPSPREFERMDLNKDGEVDMIDATIWFEEQIDHIEKVFWLSYGAWIIKANNRGFIHSHDFGKNWHSSAETLMSHRLEAGPGTYKDGCLFDLNEQELATDCNDPPAAVCYVTGAASNRPSGFTSGFALMTFKYESGNGKYNYSQLALGIYNNAMAIRSGTADDAWSNPAYKAWSAK